MSYHYPIGQFDMTHGLRRQAPAMSYAREERASASAPSQGMTYATQERGSAQAPRRSTLTYKTMQMGALPSLRPIAAVPKVARPGQTAPAAMSFADERGRLQALQILARPYAAVLAEAVRAQGLTMADRARLAEMMKTTRQLSAALGAVSPHPRGWIRADIDRLKRVVPLLPQPSDMQLLARAGQGAAVGYARQILQAWAELFGSLRAGGWWTEAPVSMTLRTDVRTTALAPVQRADIPGYQATDTVAPVEEPLAPEVEQPHDATQPMPDRPECYRVPAPPDCFPGSHPDGYGPPGPGARQDLLPPSGEGGGGGIPWWAWVLAAGAAGGGLYLVTRKR